MEHQNHRQHTVSLDIGNKLLVHFVLETETPKKNRDPMETSWEQKEGNVTENGLSKWRNPLTNNQSSRKTANCHQHKQWPNFTS